MIERNFLDQTQDRELRRPPQRMVQSNFGMEEQRRIAEQGLSQNERVLELPNQGGGMPANPDGRSYAGGSPGLYAPGGKFSRVGGIIQRQNDEDSKLLSFRQLQNNLEPADAQLIRGNNRAVFDVNNRAVFDVSGPIRAGGGGSMGMPANPYRDRLARRPEQFPNPDLQPQPAQELPNQGGGRNPSQTYQNQEKQKFFKLLRKFLRQ
jgi:hypothetical protein